MRPLSLLGTRWHGINRRLMSLYWCAIVTILIPCFGRSSVDHWFCRGHHPHGQKMSLSDHAWSCLRFTDFFLKGSLKALRHHIRLLGFFDVWRSELWTCSEYPGVTILMQKRCTQVPMKNCINLPLRWTINRLYCQTSSEVIIKSKKLLSSR